MNNALDTVLTRLFQGRQERMDSWVSGTQARAVVFETQPVPALHTFSTTAPPEEKVPVLEALCRSVAHDGFAFYAWHDSPADSTAALIDLLQSLSLQNTDKGVMRDATGLSLLQDLSGTPKGRFPPYQAKTMNWHTDGYYNAPNDAIRCFTLHCLEPASEGGELCLMDDTLLVLALLHDDVELLALLSHPEAMMLPSNQDELGHDRPDRRVPMIQANKDGTISARFTTRTEHIQWRCAETQAAAKRATELIGLHKKWQVRRRLSRREGIITRNILHAREAFVDEPEQPNRQMLRGRFNTLPKSPVHENTV